MLRQINFTMRGIKYIMLFDSDKMTEEEALIECEFVGCGMGHKEELFPYYLIVEEMKKPILNCIRDFVKEKYCVSNQESCTKKEDQNDD